MLVAQRIPVHYVFDKVKADVFRVMAFSIVFQALKYWAASALPEVPLQLPAVLGTTISLLIAFNVNQSYDRWWEARKIWGSIVNDSRSLIMQLHAFVKVEDGDATRNTLTAWAQRQIVWCYSLGQSLRGLPALTEEQTKLLSEEDVACVGTHTNVPLALLMRHDLELKHLHKAGLVNDFQQVEIDRTIVRLCDSMGRAERIKSTVFPVTYRLFLHVFIYTFLIVLSFALVETVGLYEVPILVLVASTFFLIEKTALHMQDPFQNRPTDTAVTAIARTIEGNLRQLTGQSALPPSPEPQRFYVM